LVSIKICVIENLSTFLKYRRQKVIGHWTCTDRVYKGVLPLMLSMLTHKFRLYPSKKHEEMLLHTLDLCRQTYNILLGELNEQKVIDRAIIQGTIPDIKICEPKFKNVYSKTLQYECYRLFSNLKALSQTKKKGNKVGGLRFKGKGWFKTFTYNQSGFKLIKTDKKHRCF